MGEKMNNQTGAGRGLSRPASGAITSTKTGEGMDDLSSICQLPLLLRVRIGAHDAHYGGGLVDGAKMLQLFGDAATELLIRRDGDEGLFRAYESVEFLAPVRAGDYIEVRGHIVGEGRTSRRMALYALRVIESLSQDHADFKGPSSAEVVDPPVLVCRAIGTCVTPLSMQRLVKE